MTDTEPVHPDRDRAEDPAEDDEIGRLDRGLAIANDLGPANGTRDDAPGVPAKAADRLPGTRAQP